MSGVGANDRDVMLGEIELALPPLAVHVVSIWDGRTDGRQNSMVALGRSITLVDKVLPRIVGSFCEGESLAARRYRPSFDLSLQIRRNFQTLPSKHISTTQQSQILIPARVRYSITAASRAAWKFQGPKGKVGRSIKRVLEVPREAKSIASRACCKFQAKATP